MALEFKKDDETCSNVYLIDERLCLANSFEIINTNVVTLSTNLNSLQNYSNNFNALYSNFSNNSARWIRAISNFQTLSAGWFSAETTVKTLSSYWHTDLNVIYNKIVELSAYNLNQSGYETQIKDWLIDNFNFNCVNGQVITVDLYLYRIEKFSWDFSRSYYESCIPINQDGKPSIGTNCKCNLPSVQCNHVRVDDDLVFGKKFKQCVNAVDYCNGAGSGTIVGSSGTANCPNIGFKNITLSYNQGSDDKSLTRTISLKYKKVNDTIIKI
jgi:hypothetical protein